MFKDSFVSKFSAVAAQADREQTFQKKQSWKEKCQTYRWSVYLCVCVCVCVYLARKKKYYDFIEKLIPSGSYRRRSRREIGHDNGSEKQKIIFSSRNKL